MDGKQFDARGREIPDPTPAPMPPGIGRAFTLQEQIKRMIRQEVSRAAEEEDLETFEEADDFDVDEDPDPLSAYELVEGVPEWPGGVKDEDADGPEKPQEPAGASNAVGGTSTPSQLGKPAGGPEKADSGDSGADAESLDLLGPGNGSDPSGRPAPSKGKPLHTRSAKRS